MKNVIVELYNKEHELVRTERVTVVEAKVMGENWEMADRDNYYLMIL